MGVFLQKLKFLFPIEGILQTVRRFPFSVACSFVCFVVLVLNVFNIVDIQNHAGISGRILVLGACGFLWFGIAQLITESRRLSLGQQVLLPGVVLALLAAGVFLFSDIHLIVFLGMVMPALLLGVTVAPYIGSRDNLSFWFFNKQLCFGVAIAAIAGFLWAAGISAALGSIHYLFSVDIDDEIYALVWIFSATLFSPIYGLSWVPEKFFYTEEDCHAPKQLAFSLNWVMAPLVIVYLAILYAYFAKIAVTQEIPRGQLASMIGGLGVVGILTYLSGWPLRYAGAAPLRLVLRSFFPALIVPVLVMFYAIGLRVAQYGITEQRYIGLLAALWLGICAVAFTWERVRRVEAPLKIIPATLIVLMLIVSCGPLGVLNISARSQFERLEELLMKYELVKDGKFVKATQEIPLGDQQSIGSGIDYLHSRKRGEWLEPWMGKKNPSVQECVDALGISYEPRWGSGPFSEPPGEGFSFNYYNEPAAAYIGGYEFMLNSNTFWKSDDSWTKDADLGSDGPLHALHMEVKDNMLYVQADGGERLSFDLSALARERLKMNAKDRNQSPIVAEGANTQLKARVSFSSLSGKIMGDVPMVESGSFNILLGRP